MARRAGGPAAGYRSRVARVLLVVTGVVAALVGAALLAVGIAFAVTFGSDDRLTTAPTRVDGVGVALLVDDLRVRPVGLSVPDDVGSLTISAASPDGTPLFLGAASSADIDTYLVGAPYDVVVDALPPGGAATTRAVPGTQQPAPPATQQIWIRQDVGDPASIPARVPDGAAVVVMREDASVGVSADLVATLEVENAWTASLVAVGAGAVLVVLGVVLVVLGVRRGRGGPPAGAHSAVAPASAPVAADVVPGVPLATDATDATTTAVDAGEGLTPGTASGG